MTARYHPELASINWFDHAGDNLACVPLRPMSEAPRDGTVILAFLDGTDYGQPVRWGKRASGYGESHWRMAWDETPVWQSDLIGWINIPTYKL